MRSDNQDTTVRRIRSRHPVLQVMVIAAICIGVLFILNHSLTADRVAPAQVMVSAIPAAATGQGGQAARSEAKTEQAVAEEARALAVTKLREASNLANSTLVMADRLEKEVKHWEAEVVPLLTNEQGRRLAAHPDLTRTFDSLHTALDRPTLEQVRIIRSRIQLLTKPVREALDDPESHYRPAEEMMATLTMEREGMGRILARAQYYNEMIDSLLASAADSPPDGTPTLQQAIENLKREQSLLQARLVAEHVAAADETARKEVAKMLADLRSRVILQAGEAEARLIAAQAEKANAETELARAKLEAETAQLRADAKTLRAQGVVLADSSVADADLGHAKIESGTASTQAAADVTRKVGTAAADAKRTDGQTTAVIIGEDADYQRRLALAHNESVKAKFAVFLTPGYYAFGGPPYVKSRFPKPVSFNALNQLGAFQSAEKFANAMCAYKPPWSYNDRPSRPWPRTQQEIDTTYKELLEQFLDLAPIWIADGKLLK